MKIPETPKIEKKENIPFAPPYWKTNGFLIGVLDVSGKTISRIVEPYRITNPEYFSVLQPPKGPISEHYSPELVAIITDEIKKIPKAPEGWVTNKVLADNLKTDKKIITHIIKKYRTDHPEYFKIFRPKRNAPCEHYSPNLVKLVTEEIERNVRVPEGWMANRTLAESLGVSRDTTKRIAANYRVGNPEYFKTYFAVSDRGTEYYAPELVAIIIKAVENFKNTPEAPAGWMTLRSMFIHFAIDQRTIEKMIERHIVNHAKYIHDYKFKDGNIYTYYSPELVAIIQQEVFEYKKILFAPIGWKTLRSLIDDFHVNRRVIKKILAEYCASDEYVSNFKDKGGHIREHYSPECVSIVSKEIEKIKKIPSPPIGWKTNNKLANDLGMGFKQIDNIAENHRAAHPEYFKKFKLKGGPVREHFSPELVKIIKKEIGKKKEFSQAPEDWQTKRELSEKTGISMEDIEKLVDRHRKEKPEDIGKFKDRKNI